MSPTPPPDVGPPLPPPPRPPFPWRTLILVAGTLGLALIAFLTWQNTVRAPAHAVHQVASVVERAVTNLPALAERFLTGQITHTFQASLPKISTSGGDILEVATLESEETFRREDARLAFWDTLYLGTTVSEIRVPVTYRYHLRLSDPWELAARDRVCLVRAPVLRPSQPPAIHTDRMVKSTERGWARLNEVENLNELERSITPTLKVRAREPERLNLVRETSRQAVADFVRRWLLQEDHWRHDRFSAVIVVFADETPDLSNLDPAILDRPPTLSLDRDAGFGVNPGPISPVPTDARTPPYPIASTP